MTYERDTFIAPKDVVLKWVRRERMKMSMWMMMERLHRLTRKPAK